MIIRHTCKNGLRIVLEDIPTVRSVTIGIFVLAGSKFETIHNNGISHFIEHMFFKGTEQRSAKDIAEAFDSIGGHINAFTSKEYTCYYAKVLDNHKEYALEILSDMFFHSVFNDLEMQIEKKVVQEEIKLYEDTPDDLVHDLLAKASFGDHSLAYPILGTEDHLKGFTKEMIHQYLNERYIPENIVISIAGNVNENFIQTIENYFNRFEGSPERYVGKKEKPKFFSNEIKKFKDTEQAHFCLGYNGLKLNDERIYSLIVLNNILGGSMSSRLFQKVREKHGLAYAVFSYHSSFLDNGLLTIYAGTSKQQLNKVRDIIQKMINQIVKEGITELELQNSKEQLKGNLVLSLESTNSRMSRNGKNELLLNKHRTLDQMLRDVDAVSQDSVQAITQSIFTKKPSTAIVTPK